jgi:hypothetical protein
VQIAYVADLLAGARATMASLDPAPFFAAYGNNSWAIFKAYLDAAAAETAAASQCQERGCTLMLGCWRARDRRSSGSPVATIPPPRRIAVATTRASTVWHEFSRSR